MRHDAVVFLYEGDAQPVAGKQFQSRLEHEIHDIAERLSGSHAVIDVIQGGALIGREFMNGHRDPRKVDVTDRFLNSAHGVCMLSSPDGHTRPCNDFRTFSYTAWTFAL